MPKNQQKRADRSLLFSLQHFIYYVIMALYAVLRIGSDLFIDVLAVVVFNKGVVYFFDELHVRIGHVCQKQQTEKSEENYQNYPVPSHFYFLLNYQLRLSS